VNQTKPIAVLQRLEGFALAVVGGGAAGGHSPTKFQDKYNFKKKTLQLTHNRLCFIDFIDLEFYAILRSSACTGVCRVEIALHTGYPRVNVYIQLSIATDKTLHAQ